MPLMQSIKKAYDALHLDRLADVSSITADIFHLLICFAAGYTINDYINGTVSARTIVLTIIVVVASLLIICRVYARHQRNKEISKWADQLAQESWQREKGRND